MPCTVWYMYRIYLYNLKYCIYHKVILLWIHEAEANVFIAETCDIVTFSDDDATLSAVIINITCRHIILEYLHKHEVCVRTYKLDGLAG